MPEATVRERPILKLSEELRALKETLERVHASSVEARVALAKIEALAEALEEGILDPVMVAWIPEKASYWMRLVIPPQIIADLTTVDHLPNYQGPLLPEAKSPAGPPIGGGVAPEVEGGTRKLPRDPDNWLDDVGGESAG